MKFTLVTTLYRPALITASKKQFTYSVILPVLYRNIVWHTICYISVRCENKSCGRYVATTFMFMVYVIYCV